MGRIKGSVSISTNYEPLISGPFDARSLVQYKKDLILEKTWKRPDGVMYIYNGMLVGVYKDTAENNGYYMLTNKEQYDLETSWLKMADINTLKELSERVDSIDTSMAGGAIQVQNKTDLPSVGEENKVYFVISENATYRWSNTTQEYVCCGSDYNEIRVISGGDAYFN